MARWLCKVEPDCYSITDLARDKTTTWDGVDNPAARQHLRAMKTGDRVLFYHTGKEKAVVGEMEVAAEPTAPADDAKAVAVAMKYVATWATPVSLAAVKAETTLEAWDLVRLPRLSVMPVTDAQWKAVARLAKGK